MSIEPANRVSSARRKPTWPSSTIDRLCRVLQLLLSRGTAAGIRSRGNRGGSLALPSPTAARGAAQAAFQAVLGFAFSSKNGTRSARKEPKGGKEHRRKERGGWKRGKRFEQKEDLGREKRREQQKQSK